MELMGTCRILQETGRSKANAVILPQEGIDESVLCSQLLAVYPDLTIVSLASDVDAAFVSAAVLIVTSWSVPRDTCFFNSCARR